MKIASNVEGVVFTNGCFDIPHAGHGWLLRKAKELGSFLVVGVDSDRSVVKVKGREPIFGEDERLALVKAHADVDVAFVFETEELEGIIEEIRPSVIVKGDDYKTELEVVGWQYAQVRLIPRLPHISTSEIMRRVMDRLCPREEV